MDWTQFAVTVITTLTPMVLGYLQLRSEVQKLKVENAHLREDNEVLQERVNVLELENKEKEAENKALYDRLLKARPGNKL